MTGPVAALLGIRIDGVDPSPFVAGVYLLAGLLFLIAMRSPQRRGNRLALAGLVLACAAAVYSHDVVNLPEMVGAVIIGGGIGLLLVRRAAQAVLPTLIGLGLGLLGAAAMALAAAILRNRGPFDLEGAAAICAIIGGLIGAVQLFAALLAGWTGRIGDGLVRLWLIAGAGAAGAMLGLAIGNSAMVMGGALAASGSLTLGWRVRKMGPAASGGLPRAPGLP